MNNISFGEQFYRTLHKAIDNWTQEKHLSNMIAFYSAASQSNDHYERERAVKLGAAIERKLNVQ